MAYVYKHTTKNKEVNEVFYIGIGSDEGGKYKRAYWKHNRSDFWHKVINKYDYEIEILFDNLTFEEAKLKEIELIKLYGRKNLGLGTLVNLTDGGDGNVGLIVSEEVRKMMSEYRKGKKLNPFTEEHKLKISIANTGKKASEETKRKIGEASKRRAPATEETRRKISEASKNSSKETRMKISQANSGENHPLAKSILNLKTKEIFKTMIELASLLGISESCLSNNLNGKTKVNKYPDFKIIGKTKDLKRNNE